MCLICESKNIELKELELCSNVEQLNCLPKTVTHLVIRNNKHIKELPILHEGVLSLKCSDCPNLASIPNLPESLDALCLTGLKIEVLPKLNSGLTYLYIRELPNLKRIEELPSNLTVLSLMYVGIETLPDFPESLDELTLYELINIKELPRLSSKIGSLSLTYLPKLKEIKNLPDGLRSVQIEFCKSLVDIPIFEQSFLKTTSYIDFTIVDCGWRDGTSLHIKINDNLS